MSTAQSLLSVGSSLVSLIKTSPPTATSSTSTVHGQALLPEKRTNSERYSLCDHHGPGNIHHSKFKPLHCVLLLIMNYHFHMQYVHNEYTARGAMIGADLHIEFESSKISLQLPSDGALKDGWKIVPLFDPRVSQCLACIH